MVQRFGDLLYDGAQQRTTGPDGEDIHLRPGTLAVLSYLARQDSRVVCKEELLNAGWGDIHVSDDSLYQCIAEIRRAIGAESRSVLNTIPKRGYRLRETGHGAAQRTDPVLLSNPAPIRYTTSRDGVRIAWTESGAGVPVLKAPNWISHLGAERRSLVYAPFYERLGRTARLVRYDQRGNGMSDWDIPPFTLDAMVEDMEAVADAAGLERFVLLGLSQGVAFSIAFAARHPERVLGIIGRGGYACGALASGREKNLLSFKATMAMVRAGWGDEAATYRRYFTARIAPDATPEMARQFDEMQKISVPQGNIEAFLDFNARLDIRDLAGQVTAPVLLTHVRGDRLVPFDDGRDLAATLPNGRFMPIEGDNHTPTPGTPGFGQALSAMENFLHEVADDHSQGD